MALLAQTQSLSHCLLSTMPAGVSNLVSDRDFVLRATRVCFPNDMCVLTCDSVGPGEAVPGDPGPMPRMIRWAGFVTLVMACSCE